MDHERDGSRASQEAKLLKFAGLTSCIWISLVWLLFLPALLLLAICRAPRCGTVADTIVGRIVGRIGRQEFDKDGLPIVMKSATGQQSADDREALVGTGGPP